MTEELTEKLTDEQIENWRRVLVGMVGPYAFLMPKEQIQAFRDRAQAQVAALDKPCTCPLGDGPAGVCGICGGVRK